MFFSKTKGHVTNNDFKNYIKSKTFQQLAIGIITVLIVFVIIETGAAPKKYKLNLGDKSPYDITAPRDTLNTVKVEEKAKAAVQSVKPVMKQLNTAAIDVLNITDNFISSIENQRKTIVKNLEAQGISKKDKNYKDVLKYEQQSASARLSEDMKTLNVPLSNEQISYLVSKADDDEIARFRKVTMELVGKTMAEDITQDDLASKILQVQNGFQSQELDQDLKNVGTIFVKAVLKANREIDDSLSKAKREEAYKETYDEASKTERILKDERIISFGDIVTADKLKILEDLNLLETKGRFDFPFALGILAILVLLALILVVYMYNFCRDILYNRDDILLMSVVIILTIGIARVINGYSALAIPIFLATMLISIMLDLQLAVAVNMILTITISFIAKGNFQFIYMALISGAFSAFLVSRAYQRSKLSMAGVIVGLLNVLIIVCYEIINRNGAEEILHDSIIVFINGIGSIILTIGVLPFFEATFNIITPLKLLELANPNQPLIKRLLVEAPGTYHHSLMVGNLAEVATEAIGGNALLARVGAYYHDVGKIKRPNFFKENQMADNPHDRMTANLSTLVITSHTRDGLEIAQKYKIPMAIRKIIMEHHGTTLVAYFYHKAKKGEKCENVKQENFRYEGPKPSIKESAVVMLADSVEAAVRSMVDKTEGKIEGLVRKIIKDKLDDGQLDLCNLTLKDLDDIANGFMRALSGLFHERQEYPEIKVKHQNDEDNELHLTVGDGQEQKQAAQERGNICEDYNRESAE